MKILIGVLHTIENEFDQCLAAIKSQTLPVDDVFVISGKPNKEANDELYQTFMNRAGEVDLFIRIDADMILTRLTFCEEIAGYFQSKPELNHLMIQVYDWITDRRIMGLHVFRNTHRWNIGDERFFIDVIDEDKNIEADFERFAPAATHCADPSAFQAFHYGLHKAVKFGQFTRETIDVRQRENHWRHFKALDRHSRREDDIRLVLARAGFIHALASGFDHRNVNYSCKESRAAFESFAGLDAKGIHARLRAYGPLAWTFLPFRLRRMGANWYLKKHGARSAQRLG
jgi:hypothetical protein